MINPEIALVYGAMIAPEIIPAVETVPEDFESGLLGDAWKNQRAIWAEHGTCNWPLLSERLGASQTTELRSALNLARDGAVMAREAPDYARLVKSAALRRRVSAAIRDAFERSVSDEDDIGVVLSDAIATLTQLADARGSRAFSVSKLVNDWIDEAERYRLNPSERRYGVPTGFTLLDGNLPAGGLPRGGLTIVGARTSHGKSSLLNAISENVSRAGMAVDFYTFEDTPTALTVRHISRVSSANNRDLQGYSIQSGDREAVYAAAREIGKRNISIYQTTRCVDDLQLEMVNNAVRRKTDLILVDYVQKLSSRRKTDSRNTELGHISQVLFDVATKTGAALVCASQLRRLQDARPTLNDLRDSGNIEQDAHVVMLLHRPQPDGNIVEVIVAKNKNGPAGSVPMRFIRHSSTFVECSPEDLVRYEQLQG